MVLFLSRVVLTFFFFFLNAGRYIQACAAIPSEPHTHVHLPRRVLCLSSSVDLLADVVMINSKIFRLPLAWIQSVYEYYEYLQKNNSLCSFSPVFLSLSSFLKSSCHGSSSHSSSALFAILSDSFVSPEESPQKIYKKELERLDVLGERERGGGEKERG